MTIEQKDRKNQLAREKRLRDKENLIQLRQKEIEEQIPKTIEDDSDDYDERGSRPPTTKEEEVVEENEVVQENPEEIRKKEISAKRRASLAIARSKIKPKSQITKEKDEEIAKIKEENEKLKYETQKAKEVKPMIDHVMMHVITLPPLHPCRSPGPGRVEYATTYAAAPPDSRTATPLILTLFSQLSASSGCMQKIES
jgi:hypothetical protein